MKRRRCKSKSLHDPHPWNNIAYPSFGKRLQGKQTGLTEVDYWCPGRKSDQPVEALPDSQRA